MLDRPQETSESQRVQTEMVSNIVARGLPWVMKAEHVAKQVLLIMILILLLIYSCLWVCSIHVSCCKLIEG